MVSVTTSFRTVPELFEEIVAKGPDAPAVIFAASTVNYRELNVRANRLARCLVARGVGPDSLVAIAVPRSIELVVVILAVLKAGGAYLPLDPAYPRNRLSHMVSDARPVLLVRTEGVRVPVAGLPEVVLDDPGFLVEADDRAGHDLSQAERREPLRPAHLMYVIYTSGSTGTPKGVAVSQHGVTDLVATQAARFGAGPGDRVLQWASVSFDAAFWDLTLALLSGATLVVAGADDVLPGQSVRDTLLRNDITHAVLPPVVLSITDSDGLLKGGTIMSTGDACTPALVRDWSRGRRMYNGYGPTEATVGATISGPIREGGGDVSIGVPWIGGRVYVLDERLRPVPDGQEGELYLAGTGLARGYLNRPGLTATWFVADPFGPPGSRMYRSGDRGWRRADGEFFFAGRADRQVKLRGFRIELGEVEACLGSHPDVDLAGVVVEGKLADARIVGYVQTRAGTDVSGAQLRQHVASSLPEHMVPASIAVLDHLPVTANGKVDRRALELRAVPRPAEVVTLAGASFEDALCALVTEVLAVPEVRPSDNIFELGGNSVAAAKLAGRIRKELGVSVPMRAVFETETLSDLAVVLVDQEASPG
jgi:amino acid adenylation domain-containing protein